MTPIESLVVSKPNPAAKDPSRQHGGRSLQDHAQHGADADFRTLVARFDTPKAAQQNRINREDAIQKEDEGGDDEERSDATAINGTLAAQMSPKTDLAACDPSESDAALQFANRRQLGSRDVADGVSKPEAGGESPDMLEDMDPDMPTTDVGKRAVIANPPKQPAVPRLESLGPHDMPLRGKDLKSPADSDDIADLAKGAGLNEKSSSSPASQVVAAQRAEHKSSATEPSQSKSPGRNTTSAAMAREDQREGIRSEPSATPKSAGPSDVESRLRSMMQQDVSDTDSGPQAQNERDIAANHMRPAPISFSATARDNSAGLARHVATQMAAAVQHRPNGVTEIALNPEELGRVQLTLRMHEQAVTVMIVAERAETADMMRRHVDQLAQEFRALGFNSVAFNFDGQSARQGQDRAQASSNTAPDLSAAEQVAMASPVPLPSRHHGSLDLRV